MQAYISAAFKSVTRLSCGLRTTTLRRLDSAEIGVLHRVEKHCNRFCSQRGDVKILLVESRLNSYVRLRVQYQYRNVYVNLTVRAPAGLEVTACEQI